MDRLNRDAHLQLVRASRSPFMTLWLVFRIDAWTATTTKRGQQQQQYSMDVADGLSRGFDRVCSVFIHPLISLRSHLSVDTA